MSSNVKKGEVEVLTCAVVDTTRTHTVKINRAMLLQLLPLGVPGDAEVYIQVPGGGDWSNISLEISDEHPVLIQWKTHEQSVVDTRT